MKKITLLVSMLFIYLFSSAQPDYWTSKTSLTGHPRMAGAAFSIGNKGFVGMGTDFNATQSQLKDFWEYDPATDSYSQIADYPGGGVNGAGTFTLGSLGYVSCGAGNGNFYNDLWAYDTLTNSWTQKSSLPGSVRDYTVGFSINGKGYICTGYTGSQDLNDLWEYDPVADNWTSRAGIALARSSAAGFSIGNKGYLATGYAGGGTYDCWEFDPAGNSWTQKADVSNIPRSDGVGFSIGGYGYICSGYGINYPDFDLWEYEPVANSWTQRSPLNGLGRANPVAFTIGMKGYVFGGSDPAFNALDDMHEYTPDTILINKTPDIFTGGTTFQIFPNPAVSKLSVRSRQLTIRSVSFYNPSGIKVLEYYVGHGMNTYEIKADVTGLSAGIYTVVLNDDRLHAVKFVRQD